MNKHLIRLGQHILARPVAFIDTFVTKYGPPQAELTMPVQTELMAVPTTQNSTEIATTHEEPPRSVEPQQGEVLPAVRDLACYRDDLVKDPNHIIPLEHAVWSRDWHAERHYNLAAQAAHGAVRAFALGLSDTTRLLCEAVVDTWNHDRADRASQLLGKGHAPMGYPGQPSRDPFYFNGKTYQDSARLWRTMRSDMGAAVVATLSVLLESEPPDAVIEVMFTGKDGSGHYLSNAGVFAQYGEWYVPLAYRH